MARMDARARKISETLRARKLDNFKRWRDQMKAEGRIKTSYPAFEKNGDLAELIGVVLGDGHIQVFPRTERLLIFSNAANTGFIERYRQLVSRTFDKEPYVYKQSKKNCIRISIYQKQIAARLGVPAGSRKDVEYVLPTWIRHCREHVIRFLRGLYEAEGWLSHHPGTYTHKFVFTNTNPSLLKLVFREVENLGFHPHTSKYAVQLSKGAEVQKLVDLLQFRNYKL